MLGWGRFGRSRIYDIYGKDISVTDGRWIITLGQFGLIGFLAEFGLLALPIFQLARKINLPISSKQKMYLASLALLLAINLVDLLPNAALNSWTWLLAGALSGSVASFRALAPRKQTLKLIEVSRKRSHTRLTDNCTELFLRSRNRRRFYCELDILFRVGLQDLFQMDLMTPGALGEQLRSMGHQIYYVVPAQTCQELTEHVFILRQPDWTVVEKLLFRVNHEHALYLRTANRIADAARIS